MNEETKNEYSWLEPSEVGSEFMRHSKAMELAALVPVGKAFSIQSGHNVGMLRKMADGYKPKKIAVIDHGESGIEIRRLNNNDDLSLFYASIKTIEENENKIIVSTKFGDLEDCFNHLVKAISQFTKADSVDIVKYDGKSLDYRKESCLGYAYLQRRLASISAFKNYKEGSTEAIRKVIFMAQDLELLSRLDEDETTLLFQNSAAVYRINKIKLEDLTAV